MCLRYTHRPLSATHHIHEPARSVEVVADTEVLVVGSAGDRYAIPQLAVIELVRVRSNSEHRIEHIKDAARTLSRQS